MKTIHICKRIHFNPIPTGLILDSQDGGGGGAETDLRKYSADRSETLPDVRPIQHEHFGKNIFL